jgi:hypothetical protein
MTHSPVCLEMGIGSSSTSDIDLNGSATGQHGGTKKKQDHHGSEWIKMDRIIIFRKTHIKKTIVIDMYQI